MVSTMDKTRRLWPPQPTLPRIPTTKHETPLSTYPWSWLCTSS
eukprot:TCALIF_10664-PA protein Name:"Protein of unknown function" AED:0.00 eAED:0.00 QI:418/1/1/1/0.33/0.5/4/527/42